MAIAVAVVVAMALALAPVAVVHTVAGGLSVFELGIEVALAVEVKHANDELGWGLRVGVAAVVVEVAAGGAVEVGIGGVPEVGVGV